MRKQQFFKGVTVLALAGVIMAGTALTSLAAAGRWEKDDIGWWWKRIGGVYPVHTWEWIDGNNDGLAECYYFDENGYMLANTTTPDGYIVNADGAWVENGIVQSVGADSRLHDVGAAGDINAASTSGAIMDGKSWPQMTFDETLLKAHAVNGLDFLADTADTWTQIEPEHSNQGDFGPVYIMPYKGKNITLDTSTSDNGVVGYEGPVGVFFNNFPEQGIELNAFYDNTGYVSLSAGRQPQASTGNLDAVFKLPQGSYRMGWGYVKSSDLRFQILLTPGEDGKWYIFPDSPMHTS